MAGNIIVTTTVNKVTWDVDKSAYGKAMKQIRSLKKEWEKTSRSTATAKNNPAANYVKSAAQAKLVSKRLAQVERAEQTKTTAHAIAQTKKRLRAEQALEKQHAQRRAQVLKQMTARDPQLAQMRKYYQGLQKQKASKPAFPGADWKSPNRPSSFGSATGRYTPSGVDHLGRPGQTTDEARIARQNASMRGAPPEPRVDPQAAKAREQARKRQEREDRAYDKLLTGKETTINDNAIRLRAKYGNNYAKKLGGKNGGLDALNNKFLDSATMRASTYRAELAAMERQFRSTNSAGMSFADGLKTIRRSMIGLTAAYSAFNGAASIISTGQFFQGMEATMLMVSDTSQEAGEKLKFVQGEAYRLGLDLKVASQGYTQMAVSAKGVISALDTNRLFTGLSEFATASGADPVKYQRAITAIGQMLGKNQIQAEELKGQLSEALPGAMQIFVQAAQKHFKDDKIGVPELQELMKNGQLLAKDILPLVAEGFAEAARKGGALDKQLKGNRVAMERMRQSWMVFQNKIFESGFGEQMTETFNNIADLLSENGELAGNIGQFAKGIIEAFQEIFLTIHDVFLASGLIIEAFMKKLGVQMDTMDDTFNFAGRAIGALIFVSALTRLFSILGKIAGLGAGLKFLKDIFGGGMPDGEDKAKKSGGLTRFGKLARIGGLYGLIAGESMIGGDYLFDQAREFSENQYGKETTAGGNLYKGSLPGKLWDFITGQRSDTDQRRLDYLRNQGMMPGVSQSSVMAGNGQVPVAPLEGEIKLTIDAGEMSKLIDARIEMSEMQNINLIYGGGQF